MIHKRRFKNGTLNASLAVALMTIYICCYALLQYFPFLFILFLYCLVFTDNCGKLVKILVYVCTGRVTMTLSSEHGINYWEIVICIYWMSPVDNFLLKQISLVSYQRKIKVIFTY